MVTGSQPSHNINHNPERWQAAITFNQASVYLPSHTTSSSVCLTVMSVWLIHSASKSTETTSTHSDCDQPHNTSVWHTQGDCMNAEWLEVGLWPQSVQQPKASQSLAPRIRVLPTTVQYTFINCIYLLIYLCCIIKLHNKKLWLQNWLHQLTCKWHSQGILTKNYLTELWSSAKFSGQ